MEEKLGIKDQNSNIQIYQKENHKHTQQCKEVIDNII